MSSLTSQSGRSVARLTRGVSRIPSVASVGQQQRGFVSSTRTSTALCANTAVRPSIAASIPVSSVSAVPRNAADQIQIRSLQSDAKDTAWVKKGPVTYEELKPETQAPSGVSAKTDPLRTLSLCPPRTLTKSPCYHFVENHHHRRTRTK